MEIIINSKGTTDHQRPKQGLNDLKTAGFDSIVYDIIQSVRLKKGQKIEDFFSEYSYGNKDLHTLTKAVCDMTGEKQLSVYAMRSPSLPLDTKADKLNVAQKQMAVETIQLASENECGMVIAAPVFAGINKSKLYTENKKYYLELAETAKKNNVTILIENQCKYYNGQLVRGLFSDQDEAASFIDELNIKCDADIFGFCMNTVNCNLCGIDMQNFAVTLGKRIKAVVISDCDGQNEAHLLPFTSVYRGNQTDWLSLIRGLREAEFDNGIIMDVSDTSAAFSPLLRPALLSLTKSVADYFKWQLEIELLLKKYDKRVLFGAGNMCRNYMKCYGEKYPPLFTCDNNSKMWGTEFCSLEIKPPDAIKNIPSDCAVFICNIYYREIEQQLREMGITNPIEYFNDEYMPSFYFDRLEMK